jgi:putative tricarboxylic transport membrane protein
VHGQKVVREKRMGIARIEGGILAFAGLVTVGDALRLIFYRNPRSIEDITGPGRYLLIVGTLLVLAALAYAALQAREPVASAKSAQDTQDAQEAPSDREGLSKLLWVFGALVVYALLMPILGYLIATAVFFLAAFRIFGFRSWWATAGMTVVFAGACYLIFAELFSMPFPRGLILP